MPVERVVGEAHLRRADLEGVGGVRLASRSCPGGKLIADLVSIPPGRGGFTSAGRATLTVMVDDVDDHVTRVRVLRRLGIDGVCESAARSD